MSFQYIKPTHSQIDKMQKFRDKFQILSAEIEADVPPSRERSLAITKLEESSFWLNKGITHSD